MPYAAVAISLFALAFTIGSFWWLHARRGSLTATAPRVYAFSSNAMRLRLPLVIYNSSVKPGPGAPDPSTHHQSERRPDF